MPLALVLTVLVAYQCNVISSQRSKGNSDNTYIDRLCQECFRDIDRVDDVVSVWHLNIQQQICNTTKATVWPTG